MKEQRPQLTSSRYFDLVAITFVVALLVSNIAAQKLFAFGPFTFTAGILVFPISYIFGDILTEIYGYARTRRVIWAGFAANIFLILVIQAAVLLPPAEGWPFQEQFAAVLGFVPRIVLASIAAYWAGEFSNSFVLAKMKVWMKGRHLWMRTIGSTIVGQAIDTAIFATVAFAGVLPTPVIVKAIVSGYAFKVIYEAAITPLTYFIVHRLKRAEGIDVYDERTNFSPFSTQI